MSHNRSEAKRAFARDVENHKMTVLRDEAENRHIVFRRPETSSYWFEIVTWHGILVINGDMGTYSFSRLAGMFQFFRTDSDRGDGINPGYWAEKLTSISKFGNLMEFQAEMFNREVIRYLINWIRDNRDRTSKEERRQLWDEVINEVIEADADNDGARKQIAVHDFHHQVRCGLDFQFNDFWERNFKDYSFHFYWCLYAIAWAINQYENAKLEGKSNKEEVIQ